MPDMHIVDADSIGGENGDEYIHLNELVKFLHQTPDEPTVVMVRQALRAGLTLPASISQNFYAVIDTPGDKSRNDTTVQSFIGRSCGYGKKDDTYPIYANMKEIQTSIDFFNGVEGAVPSGIKNTGVKIKSGKGRYEIVQNDGKRMVSVCSATHENDMADQVLRNQNTWADRYVYLDGPAPEHNDSWERLKKERPELIGQYAIYVKDKSDNITSIDKYTKLAKVSKNFIDKQN
jgi:hypothetical protein